MWDKSEKYQSRSESDVSEEGQAFYSEAPLDCPNLDGREKTLIPKCAHAHTAWTSPCEDAAVV